MRKLILLSALLAVRVAGAQDIVIEDFKNGYGRWEATGEAFQGEPAKGDEVRKLEIVGSRDGFVATSEREGDAPMGRLLSPAFPISRDYITYRICGGDYERHNCINLLVDGKIVRSATGRQSDRLATGAWDVREFKGKQGRIEIVDEAARDWGHINVDEIVQTDNPEVYPVATEKLYTESLRPQFHFTARQWTMNRLNPGMRQEGWINDLNGMIYYDGEYHLFAQRWNKCWLHAVSKDLVHWTELEPAFWEEELDSAVQSGTCVIDYKNTSGLSSDPKTPPMVAFWSHNDNRTHGLSYSLDHGRTWKHYDKNPILDFPERDPKVFWYEPGKHWVMFLYGGEKYHILTSTNLLDWKDEHNPIADSFECPDFFELPVDGNPLEKKWVLVQGDGKYSIGSFNGTKFNPETPRYFGDINPARFYATQTFHNVETGDGRRIQLAWIRGSDFPNMPFSQQVTFPCELKLKNTPQGLRVFRTPVREIELLHEGEPVVVQKQDLVEGEKLQLPVKGELFHIRANVSIPRGSSLVFDLRGAPLRLSHDAIQVAEASGKTMGAVKTIEILLDRASLEAFVNDGEISSTNFVIANRDGISITSEGGPSRIESLEIYPLKSAWNVAETSKQ